MAGMALKHFDVAQHVIPGQHIREYPNATRSKQEEILHLAVKQYIPKATPKLNNRSPITVIAAHGNGFPKEAYEPLWDDLFEAAASKGICIRAIWFADSSNQGASGVKNESIQGDDPNWFDHSRDLLCMVNSFRHEIVRPVVGFGHSMGCAQLVQLSIFHPRLFSSLVLIEPIILRDASQGTQPTIMATWRQDLWNSFAEAEMSVRTSKFFKKWDPRALAKYIQFSFRPVPTILYPKGTTPDSAVTLTTTKHQEAWTYVRPNFEPIGDPDVDRLLSPDLDPKNEGRFVVHRAECVISLNSLAHVRPSIFYMFGEKSSYSRKKDVDEKLSLTGSGVGGSGGVKAGKAKSTIVNATGHFAPFEAPMACAIPCVDWLVEAIEQFEQDEQFLKDYGTKKSEHGMLMVSQQWKDVIRKPFQQKRATVENL